tara:strand:- start:3276 stop:3941 length:666 start_codon:yes stop_codon:yes gene_type:complete
VDTRPTLEVCRENPLKALAARILSRIPGVSEAIADAACPHNPQDPQEPPPERFEPPSCDYDSSMDVLARIVKTLEDAGVTWKQIRHDPVRTSQEAADVRGEPLAIGGKALVVKADETFSLVVISAASRLKSSRLKKTLSARKLRFATPEELADLTGLVPGSVPPFGEPVLPLPVRVDQSILGQDRIAFNAGSLSESIIMDRQEWYLVAGEPEIIDVSMSQE